MSVFLSMNHPAVAEITHGMLKLGMPVKYVETGYTQRMRTHRDLPPVLLCNTDEFISPGKLEQELWYGRHIRVLDTRLIRFSHNIVANNRKVIECFDENIVKEYKHCERDFFYVTDRLAYSARTVRENVLYYRNLLFYWHAFFKDMHDIDVVLFRETPHAGYDIVMYHTAKHNGKQIWYPEQCRIGVFYSFRHNTEPDKTVPDHFQTQADISELKEGLDKEYLRKIELFNTEYRQQFVIQVNAPVHGKRGRWRSLVRLLKQLKRKRALSITDYTGGEKPVWYYKFLALKNMRYVKQLQRAYKQLSVNADYTQNYVLLVLHMQPERTSSPLVAGVFEDQLNIVKLIRNALPRDWLIYVKEHPHTFLNDLSADSDFDLMHSITQRKYRSVSDYDALADTHNVRLIAIEEDINALVANAHATITINGTAGWLSLLNGKPVISFGTPWYSSCASCYCVRDGEELKSAVNNCMGKSADDVLRDMWRFWAWQEHRLVDLGPFNLNEYTEKERRLLGDKAALGFAKIIGGGNREVQKNKLTLVYSHHTSSNVNGL